MPQRTLRKFAEPPPDSSFLSQVHSKKTKTGAHRPLSLEPRNISRFLSCKALRGGEPYAGLFFATNAFTCHGRFLRSASGLSRSTIRS